MLTSRPNAAAHVLFPLKKVVLSAVPLPRAEVGMLEVDVPVRFVALSAVAAVSALPLDSVRISTQAVFAALRILSLPDVVSAQS
jgi:hypothetical protein